ncbi:hypothetical protein ACF1A1_37310, partial [Streptomyces sp. NPDC014995]
DATYQGYRVGIWLKNARAAARKAAEIEQRRADDLPVPSAAGALPEDRHEQLEDIDPSWCPTWPVEWQRCFHLTRQHLEAGGTLPTGPGDVCGSTSANKLTPPSHSGGGRACRRRGMGSLGASTRRHSAQRCL